MSDMERQLAKTQALSDQSWAIMDSLLADIERIAKDGPSDERDVKITKMVMFHVAGELRRRRVESRT